MDDFTKAKVGDRLYSLFHGYVTVEAIQLKYEDFPIRAGSETYTKDGRLFKTKDAIQILFWDKPEIIGPPKPISKVKRWIKGIYGNDGKLFLAGDGMTPTLYATKNKAEEHYLYPPAFVVEVEIDEDLCDS
jgi:hypothetical protein